MSATDDFFRSRLDQMIDLRHPLAVLANRMPWQEIEASIAHRFARQARAGKKIEQVDLFGPSSAVLGAGVSKAGRPRLALRLMVSLLYLKHAFNESDEGVVQRWGETPTWQYFSGCEYFEHRWPCDASLLVRFRRALGEEGVEELLAQTINVAVTLKLIDPRQLRAVVIDSTVSPKAVAHPSDSRLLETARTKLVEQAKQAGIDLKQTYAKEGRQLRFKAGRYAHAKQFNRLRRVIARQRTVVGRISREITRKLDLTALAQAAREALGAALAKAGRILEQSQSRQGAQGSQGKLYSWHAPEVCCIAKGKSRTPYEFGAKVGLAVTLKSSLVVGARAYPHNPYDGHTLAEQLEQAAILMQDTGHKPAAAYVDLGYRGVDHLNPEVRIVHRGKKKRLSKAELRQLPRRQAIEPVIGHLKADHGLGRCHLKGEEGDRLHAVLCAAGYNIRWLLRAIARKIARGQLKAFLRALQTLGLRWLCRRIVRAAVPSAVLRLAVA